MATATANGISTTKTATPGVDEDNVIWKGDATSANKRSSAGGAQDSQWTITNGGQIYDPKSGSTWEIADEVLKLQISDDAAPVATENTDKKSSTAGDSPSGKNSTSALAPAIDLDKPTVPRQASADGDDVSSSDSSSLATPANRLPGAKMVNGNQKQKKEPFAANGAAPHYGSPFDEGLYNPSVMGAPGVPQTLPQHYSVPSGAPLPSPLMSGFPHHMQAMHGPVPPPLFSPHQMAPQAGMHDGSLGSGPRASNGQLASFPPVHDTMQHPLSPYSRPSYPGSPPPVTPYSNPMSPTLSPTSYISPYAPAIHAPPLNYPYGAPPPTMAPAQSPGYEFLTGPIDDPRNAATAMANRSQFRGHQHSASDTAALRDPASEAVVNGAMGPTPSHSHSQSLTLGTYSPPIPGSPYPPTPYQTFYALQHHSHQASQDAVNAMSRMLPYTTSGAPAAYMAAIAAGVTDAAALALVQSGAGPSANNRKLGLYKTELCRSWEEKGSCRYGAKCQFAHGEDEIRKVSRHPKYKTEICRTFWVSGSCPYGKRCCFIHTELPAAGAPGAPPAPGDAQRPGSTGASGVSNTPAPVNGTTPSGTDGRARSMSTNSDPNDAPSSLLARISAKAQANNAAAAQAANRSSEASPANGSSYGQDKVTANAIAQAYAQYGRPASSALTPGNTESSASVQDKFPATNGNIGGHGGPVHGHRVSASVDFSGHRAMADFSSQELGSGLGHQRNPSASAIHPQLSNFGQLMSPPRVGQANVRAGDSVTPNRASPGGGSRFSHERSQSGGVSRTVTSPFSAWAA